MLQSSAFAPSAQSLLPLKPRRASNPSFDPISLSSSSAASPKRRDLNNVTVSASLPCRSWSLSSSSSSPFKLRPWSSVPLATSGDEANRFEARATSVPESAGESVESNSLVKTPVLGLLFGLWYVFNIYFKQGLKVYLNPYKKPKVSGAQLLAILPLALVHTLGNLFTNMSLGKVAVSFTHTIKAMEPFFSVVLSAMFLRELPTPSLVPIVVEWDWLRSLWPLLIGVQWLPMCNQSRNVLLKKVMINKEEAIVNITLFSIITVMSVLLLAPDFIHRRCQVCTSFYTTCCIERSANIHENACCCSLLPCLPAGIIYDLGEGITCYSLCRQPCEAGGGRSGKGTELFGLPSHLFVVIFFVLLLLIQRGILFF